MAAAPIPGGGSPQDQGQVCAGRGSQGWDLQRRGRGSQGRGPFLPLLLSARGRILHCNFKCYNFLITSSQTMSSLCGEGPPPSRLVLHAPLTGSGAFMGKDSSIVWDGQLRGSHPLNPHGLPRGTAGRDPHTPSEFGRAQQALAHSPGPGGGSCSTGQLWDERSLLSAALVAVRAGPACQHTAACGWGPWPRC